MKAYSKTVYREIKHSFGRFAAIFAITALGIAFMTGLSSATPDMRNSMERYYRDNSIADINVKSFTGISEAEISEVTAADGVKTVMSAYVTDTIASAENNEESAVRVFGCTFDVNNLTLVEGRLPQNASECVVEQAHGYLGDAEVGSSLLLSGESIYSEQNLTVTGIVTSPYYISDEAEITTLGNGRISMILYAPEELYLLPRYTDLFIVADSGHAMFTDEYENEISEICRTVSAAETEKTDGSAWLVSDLRSNPGYASYKENSSKIAAISTVFPAFFLLIAALVALTTMTRMIEEERTQLGTLKALGYSDSIILRKYVLYCGSATFGGALTGLVTGFSLFPTVVYGAFDNTYRLPKLLLTIDYKFAIITFLSAVAATILVAVAVGLSAMREKPAALMRPISPKAGKRILLERFKPFWKRLSFKHKSTARNVFRYKKHLFMTVIGVAGCAALILTSFGLRDSLSKIANEQFEDIWKYDAKVTLAAAPDSIGGDGIDGVLPVYSANNYASVGEKRINITICAADNKLGEYVGLTHAGRKVVFSDSSVIITHKGAEVLGIRSGDGVTVTAADGTMQTVRITGITDNYIGNFIYMGTDAYTEAFGTAPVSNCALLKSGGDEVIERLLDEKSITYAERFSDARDSYSRLLKSMDYISIVLIFAATALGMIVMYNLTNLSIGERKKELATLRVLGYHHMEVAGHIYREEAIITLLGTAAGLLLGFGLHRLVVFVAESDALAFGRSASIWSYLFSALLTIAFSVIVDLMMLKKIRSIKMTESLKAND